MAIKVKSLERVANTYTNLGYVYKDLDLDLQFTSFQSPGFRIPIPGSDLKADYNLGAIKNSLQNLFNTLPGQRFLFPEYGLDLYQYIFSPISQGNGEIIGKHILRTIERFEQRIRVLKIQVLADPDNSLYNITLIISLPLLTEVATFNGVLDTRSQSFIFVPTSRNL